MAIAQTFTSSFLLECWLALHDLSSDALKLAFYDDTAALNYLTSAYSASHEITGTGYTAGGFALTKTATYPKLSADGYPQMDFADFTVNPATFTAYQGLIYNSSKSNRSVAVLDFPGGLVVSSNFTWTWPVPTDSTAIFRVRSAR